MQSQETATAVKSLWSPPPLLTVSAWADQNRMLSSESNVGGGRWQTDRAPYQRGMMDAANEPGVRRIVYLCSSQIGKTECINNLLGYFVTFDPASVLFVWPTLETAKRWSKQRLAPMLRDTPCLRGKVKDARSRDAENATLHKIFPGGQIIIAGANSPSSLASMPIRILLCDEVDRFPPSAGPEGDPISLGEKRQATFWNSIEILSSSPTLKGASRIEDAYQHSDQRKYLVPCPRCKAFQELKWSNVKFTDRNPATAHYICDLCHYAMSHREKFQMLKAGHWKAGADFIDTAGFRINELYSPWVTWQAMVKHFLEVNKNSERLKVFINTSLAECWEEDGASVDDGTLFSRREEYPAAVPEGGLVLTAGIDVQDDRLEMEVKAWGKDQEAWSIDHKYLWEIHACQECGPV
jgi:phage terminase large subunit GpA-like protein